MTTAIAVSMPNDTYLQRLRVLGAWWRLGSSALNPELLIEPVEDGAFREGYAPCDAPAPVNEPPGPSKWSHPRSALRPAEGIDPSSVPPSTARLPPPNRRGGRSQGFP